MRSPPYTLLDDLKIDSNTESKAIVIEMVDKQGSGTKALNPSAAPLPLLSRRMINNERKKNHQQAFKLDIEKKFSTAKTVLEKGILRRKRPMYSLAITLGTITAVLLVIDILISKSELQKTDIQLQNQLDRAVAQFPFLVAIQASILKVLNNTLFSATCSKFQSDGDGGFDRISKVEGEYPCSLRLMPNETACDAEDSTFDHIPECDASADNATSITRFTINDDDDPCLPHLPEYCFGDNSAKRNVTTNLNNQQTLQNQINQTKSLLSGFWILAVLKNSIIKSTLFLASIALGVTNYLTNLFNRCSSKRRVFWSNTTDLTQAEKVIISDATSTLITAPPENSSYSTLLMAISKIPLHMLRPVYSLQPFVILPELLDEKLNVFWGNNFFSLFPKPLYNIIFSYFFEINPKRFKQIPDAKNFRNKPDISQSEQMFIEHEGVVKHYSYNKEFCNFISNFLYVHCMLKELFALTSHFATVRTYPISNEIAQRCSAVLDLEEKEIATKPSSQILIALNAHVTAITAWLQQVDVDKEIKTCRNSSFSKLSMRLFPPPRFIYKTQEQPLSLTNIQVHCRHNI